MDWQYKTVALTLPPTANELVFLVDIGKGLKEDVKYYT